MYCNQCGVQLPQGSLVCPNCRHAAPPTQPSRVERNLSLLAALWFAMGALRLLAAIAVCLIAAVFGTVIHRAQVPFPVHVIIIVAAVFISIIAIASLAVGWGLQQRAPWGRMFAIVMAFLSLLSMPFGTALGIYTLAILLPREADVEYAALSNTAR